MTGTKQTPEWIEKRKMFGERNGMFGKHHSEKTKKKISEALKGKKVSEETKKKQEISIKVKSMEKKLEINFLKQNKKLDIL